MNDLPDQQSEGLSTRAYLRVVWRWRWLIIGLFIVGAAGGYGYSLLQTPRYSATAQLMLQSPIDLSNPLSTAPVDDSARQALLEALPSLVSSPQVKDRLAARLPAWAKGSDYSLAAVLQAGVNQTYSNVVWFVSQTNTGPSAAQVANDGAAVFVEWRKQQELASVTQEIAVIQGSLAKYQSTTQRQAAEQILTALQILKVTVTGDFQLIVPAGVPTTAYSPKPVRNGILGGAGGLLIGLLLAFLFEQFDTRLHGDDQVTGIMHLPVIGRAIRPGRRPTDGGVLGTLSEPEGVMAESYRLVRSNLEFTLLDGDSQAIMITSSMQREGKSVFSCNLAISLALAGKRVILVDGDLRSPRVHAYLNLPNTVGVTSVVAHKAALNDALIPVCLVPKSPTQEAGDTARGRAEVCERPVVRVTRVAPPEAAAELWTDGRGDPPPLLYVLPSGPLPPNPGELVASSRFGQMIEQLRPAADLVIVDSPAMLAVGDAAAIATHVGAVLFVLDRRLVRRPVLVRAREQLGHLPCRMLGMVFMQARPNGSGYGYKAYHDHPVSGNGSKTRGAQLAKR